MKVILVLIVIMFALIAAAYQFGGFKTLDPAEQVANIRNNVTAGMDWEKVVEVHEPRKIAEIRPSSMNGQGQLQTFDAAQVKQTLSKGGYANGFVFPYTFSGKDAVEVYFDSQGKVTELVKPITSSDVLNGQLFTQ